MVGGRLGQVRNVPTDLFRSLRTQIGRYLVGIGDADGGQVGAMCLIFVEIWRWIENDRKWARKPKNQSCRKWSEEDLDNSGMSPRTFYEASAGHRFNLHRFLFELTSIIRCIGAISHRSRKVLCKFFVCERRYGSWSFIYWSTQGTHIYPTK